MPVDLYTAHTWKICLIKSLQLTYLSRKTRRPLSPSELKFGTECVAHPEFAPHVIAAMDASLPKKDADFIYKQAFEASKSRAEAMLKRFDRQQHAGHAAAVIVCTSLWLALLCRNPKPRQTLFQNALARFATFAPPHAVQLLCEKKCDG